MLRRVSGGAFADERSKVEFVYRCPPQKPGGPAFANDKQIPNLTARKHKKRRPMGGALNRSFFRFL
jgi:hypothetical protein